MTTTLSLPTRTMRAAIYYGPGDIRVEETAVPERLEPTEVLIAPFYSGICGTDLHEYIDGPHVIPKEPHPLNGSQLPVILGHELAGEVIAVGDKVQRVKLGDRVSSVPQIYCGECYHCIRGAVQLCIRMASTGLSDAWGGLAKYAVVPSYQLFKVPDPLSEQQATMIEPAAVAAYAVDRARMLPGMSVLIVGAGPIGVLAAMYARAAGAAHVILVEANERRAQWAESADIGEVLPAQAEAVRAHVSDLTEGVGVDVVIEAAGKEAALNLGIDVVRAGGVLVQAALHVTRASIDPMQLALKDLRIEATWCYPTSSWPRIMNLVAAGMYPVEKVVTSVIALDDVVTEGFNALIDPQCTDLKILVDPRR